jgi:hypothetical protein
MTLLKIAPRLFAWAFEQTEHEIEAIFMDWTKSERDTLSMFLKLRYCSVSLRDALFTEIPQSENATLVMMTADLIGKAIRARLHARQEFIDWRAAVVVFGPGKCEECLMKNPFFSKVIRNHPISLRSTVY